MYAAGFCNHSDTRERHSTTPITSSISRDTDGAPSPVCKNASDALHCMARVDSSSSGDDVGTPPADGDENRVDPDAFITVLSDAAVAELRGQVK